jgi:CRISPR-associated protein Cmr5
MTQTKEKSRPTLEQQRGKRAWETVQKVLQDYPSQQKTNRLVPHAEAKKYGGQAKKLPTRIMAAGLGQALAFLKAKGHAPDLLTEVTDWVGARIPARQDEPKDLLERIVKGDSDFLRRATDEVLAYLVWLNRFAEAEGLTEGEEG